MKKAYHHVINHLLFSNRHLLLIDFFQNTLFVVIFIPFLNLLIKNALRAESYSYITAENLLDFIFSPYALLIILFILLSLPVLLYSRLLTLIYYCNESSLGNRIYVLRIIFYGLYKCLQSIRLNRLGSIVFTLPFYLLGSLPLLIGLTFHADIGRQMGTSHELVIKASVIMSLLLLSALFMDGIFAIHISTFGNMKFSEGYSLSKKLLQGRYRRTCLRYFITNALLTAGYFLVYYLVLFLLALVVCIFSSKSMAVAMFLAAYPRISFYTAAIYGIFSFIINVNLISSLYYAYQDESLREVLPGRMIFPRKVREFDRKHRYLINAVFLTILTASLINFYIILRNDSLYLSEAFSGIQITSHRGYSVNAPENTLLALENAIMANSDYAEIDVHQTKDGVLVLLHDHSLLRTTGMNRYIWDVTYDEIRDLDAGSWFGPGFNEVRIPTLEEVFIHCKGRIKLNIDLKVMGRTPDLEDKLVALIEQYEYENQCVVSSSNYPALVRIKELKEDIITGYIFSGAYGDFYKNTDVDFFSIRSSFINMNVVTSAHESGKAVHAWTVNSARELERMKTLNVDNVITDNPSYAREVLYRDDTNDSFLRLINRMFRYRSLYSWIYR